MFGFKKKSKEQKKIEEHENWYNCMKKNCLLSEHEGKIIRNFIKRKDFHGLDKFVNKENKRIEKILRRTV